MPLQTQFMTFFISPFSEPSSSAELNNFLKSHRIINVEKRLIDGERGTGWVFLVEYTENEGGKSAYTMSSNLGFLIKRNSISILSKNWKRKLRKFKQMEKEYCKVNDSDLYNRYSNMFNC